MNYLRSIIFHAAIALTIVACQSVGDTDDREPELPVVRRRDDIEALFPAYGTSPESLRVRVVGEYRQLDVRKRQTPPPVYQGHVIIDLEGGGGVILYPTWHPAAIRSPQEIERYEGQQVVFVGTLVPVVPPPPDFPHAASLVVPGLIEVETMAIAD